MIRTATLTLTMLLVAAATAANRPVSIPFADLGNIRDWRADGHDAMLIESQGGDWYRATFWAPCYELPFAETVGFVTEPGGSLNKFSSIVVGGQRCWFRTFEPVAPPSAE
jgi:hypothetical protein